MLGPCGNSMKGMIWKIKEIKKLSTEEAASQEPRTKHKCLKWILLGTKQKQTTCYQIEGIRPPGLVLVLFFNLIPVLHFFQGQPRTQPLVPSLLPSRSLPHFCFQVYTHGLVCPPPFFKSQAVTTFAFANIYWWDAANKTTPSLPPGNLLRHAFYWAIMPPRGQILVLGGVKKIYTLPIFWMFITLLPLSVYGPSSHLVSNLGISINEVANPLQAQAPG